MMLSETGKDVKVAACLNHLKQFRRAGYFARIHDPTKQVIVRDARGRKLLRWAPIKKWVTCSTPRLKRSTSPDKPLDSERFDTIAQWKAQMPKDVATMSAAEKKAELLAIKKEMNATHARIEDKVERAGTLLREAVRLVKRVGDLLARVKELLRGGEKGAYEAWVTDNFDGGLSTARRYKWRATHAKWSRVEEQLNKGGLSLTQMDAILHGDVLEEAAPEDTREQDAEKRLTLQFAKQVKTWPAQRKLRLAEDPGEADRREQRV